MPKLSVSGGHQLYYEVHGNARGLPVLYVHGGPGGGCSKADHRFFDFKKTRVIFFDQRGAGKSRPFASTKNNTTDELVGDINRLLDHLGLERVFLFGGSWGSTLSLVFAIRHPERALGLLLRGIFLGTKAENDYYLKGGIRLYFPEIWERFLSHVPRKARNNPAAYYQKQMHSRSRAIRQAYAFEWAFYEFSIMKLHTTEADTTKAIRSFPFEALSRLEAHYILRNCFLPENYILENAARLAHLPISIVQGRYDMVCPPEAAFRLHEQLPGSRLHVVTAGHTAREKPIEKMLISEMKRLARQTS
ncbi:MAG: prolyl aminopeptidase [Deltaproteobacteria bacterium]|nr:prolyl aminopeptidase [Deltaproteobacteria bacterium]